MTTTVNASGAIWGDGSKTYGTGASARANAPIGSHLLAVAISTSPGTVINYGTTYSGSNLSPCAVNGDPTGAVTVMGVGTWRALGKCTTGAVSGSPNTAAGTLWVRIS